MIPKENITGIVLAGGESSRMGQDKGMLKFKGKRFVELPLDTLKPLTHTQMIIANRPEYKELEVPVKKDLVPKMGPLGGILTAFHYATTPWIFVLACDVPLVNAPLLQLVLAHANGGEAVLPMHEGRLEPLMGLYSRECVPVLKEAQEKGNRKMMDVLKNLDVRKVPMREEMGIPEESFFNINTPEDGRQIGWGE